MQKNTLATIPLSGILQDLQKPIRILFHKLLKALLHSELDNELTRNFTPVIVFTLDITKVQGNFYLSISVTKINYLVIYHIANCGLYCVQVLPPSQQCLHIKSGILCLQLWCR